MSGQPTILDEKAGEPGPGNHICDAAGSRASLLRAIALIWRVGRGGNRVRMPKLRTMVVAAERCEVISIANDGLRVTGIGRVLRRGEIDDLPARWNLLHGAMSRLGDNDSRRSRSVAEGHKLDHGHATSEALG